MSAACCKCYKLGLAGLRARLQGVKHPSPYYYHLTSDVVGFIVVEF